MWGRRRSHLDERDEIQSHIRLEADRLESDGVPPGEALTRAREVFGYTPHLDPTGSSLRSGWVDLLSRDLRHALRRLASTPVSTGTILASLVIGIGVNTAIFSLADQTLVRALPVEAPGELVQLEWNGEFVGGGRGWGDLIPHPLYEDLRDYQSVFREMAARSPGEVTLLIGDQSERAQVELVTGSYFRLLGLRPFLGRLFTDEDDQFLDAHPIVVLSHAYWQSRFGADSTIVGRQIRLNARGMTIVGVAPPEFHGTDWSMAPAVWMPMAMNDLVHEWGRLRERRVRFQHVYARLNEGVSREEAEVGLQGWFQRYIRADMERDGWPAGIEPADLQEYLGSRLVVNPGAQGQAARGEDLRRPMLILTAATALLLLLACLNVANLSLAKAAAQYRDTVVRIALGASRTRVMFERVLEAGVLAGAGGAIGVAVAPLVSRWILRYMTVGGPAMALRSDLDSRTLATALLLSVIATLLSAAGPAWFAASTQPMGALKSRDGTSLGGFRLRKALVVGQVSLALVFLLGAGLFGTTLSTLRSEGPGFGTERLFTFTVTPTNDGYELPESKSTIRRILNDVQGLPSVTAAGVGSYPLLEGGGWGNHIMVEAGRRFETELSLPMNAVSPGFFEALGVPVTLGRDFDTRDASDEDGQRRRSAIVSEDFVERYLPGEHPIGVRIDFGGFPERDPRMEIVGVVRSYHEHGLREAQPQVFFPIWEGTAGRGIFYVRARESFDVVSPQIMALVAGIDPSLTVSDMRTFDDQIDRILVFERMLAAFGRGFAVFATLLAMIGIYAVLSFAAESRTKEMGIRVALGAPRQSVGRLIVLDAMRLGVLGVLTALPIVGLLGGFIESQLVGIRAVDPAAIAVAAAALLAVCFGASAGPAWRASSVSPTEAFRIE